MYIRVFLLFLLVFGGLLASPFVTSLGCMVLVSSDPVVTYGNKKIGMRTLFSSGSYSPIVDTRICAILVTLNYRRVSGALVITLL